MFSAISACVIKGQIVLLAIGGQPIEENAVHSIVRESQPEMVSVNRDTRKPKEHEYRKDARRTKNTKAKADHNKWKSLKRRKK